LKNQTVNQYNQVIQRCKEVFEKKTEDYGTAWRILRLPSITDQILIKSQRVRSIQEKGTQKVDEDISQEFVGIINYCIMALIQLELPSDTDLEMNFKQIEPVYDQKVAENLDLLENKNHDYGEAWREMRVTSITDIILMKLLRIKQIEDNKGQTKISEGVDANYRDIINYAVFALIKLKFVS